jgi:hypothetical protein
MGLKVFSKGDLRMQFARALDQNLFGFDAIGVWDAAVYGANLRARPRVRKAHAFCAQVRVDYEDFLTPGNGVVRTRRSASAAADALLVDHRGHQSENSF